jgi:UDP-GlcNAc:undecaprenyl-phosphate GlcNAc-1-phosphate transferase
MTLIAGWLGGAVGTWLVRGIALRFGMVAKPNPLIPQHRRPTAYLGGFGIAIGLASAMIFARPALDREFFALIVPALGFLVLGLVDDLRPLRASRKTMIQVLLAVLAVAMGLDTSLVGVRWIDAAMVVAWIVLLSNAVNVTDVCDGLAAGIAAVGLLYLGAIDAGSRAVDWGLAGACAGFLVFNRPPASIFMGDSGSLFLGFALAVLSLPTLERVTLWPGAIMTVAASALFLFEAAFLFFVRWNKRIPFWQGSSDHFSLRMQAAGMSKWRTDLVSWSIAALVCSGAALLPTMPRAAQIGLTGVGFAAALGSAMWLKRHEVVRG